MPCALSELTELAVLRVKSGGNSTLLGSVSPPHAPGCVIEWGESVWT